MIRKLNQETINLISAGEVIEAPCDILKELLENAIDANATEINIKIKASGTELLEIKDNGTGISKADLATCIERHTTSKLEKIDDLYSLNTFGFRGEALASINAISKMEIKTSTTEDGKGFLLKENLVSSIVCQKGTTISVNDIFYNVPVRKKFLKSKSQEFSKLYNTFLEFVIQYPKIRFQFISEKKNETFSNTTQENRYLQVFGSEVISKTKLFNIKSDFFNISGIITKPESYFFYPNNYIYINKRPVYSAQITKAISKCYKDYLMIQQRPFFVLFIELNSKTIDINIHPKKRQIKIQNEILFINQFKQAIEGNLFPKSNKETQSIKSIYESIGADFKNNLDLKEPKPVMDYSEPKEKDAPVKIVPAIKQPPKIYLDRFEIREIIGQLFDTFIICKTPDGLLLIDQHAAEERINLEKNRRLYENDFKIQNLVIPKRLDFISFSQKEFILKNKKLLENLGFKIKHLEDALFLETIPEFLEHYFDHTFFLDVLEDLEDGADFNLNRIKDKILKLKSCKESIKANDVLTISQIYSLIQNLNKCVDKTICAHGRPTYILLNKKELEKMFKRII